MSFTVSNDVSGYLTRAADLRRKAETSVFPDIRAHLLELAENWETLAGAAGQYASPFAATPLPNLNPAPSPEGQIQRAAQTPIGFTPGC